MMVLIGTILYLNKMVQLYIMPNLLGNIYMLHAEVVLIHILGQTSETSTFIISFENGLKISALSYFFWYEKLSKQNHKPHGYFERYA